MHHQASVGQGIDQMLANRGEKAVLEGPFKEI